MTYKYLVQSVQGLTCFTVLHVLKFKYTYIVHEWGKDNVNDYFFVRRIFLLFEKTPNILHYMNRQLCPFLCFKPPVIVYFHCMEQSNVNISFGVPLKKVIWDWNEMKVRRWQQSSYLFKFCETVECTGTHLLAFQRIQLGLKAF